MDPLLLSGLFQAAEKLIDHFFPDAEKQAQARLELLKLQESGELQKLAAATDLAKAQIDLDKAEVQSGSLLGKWRGGLGWLLAGSAAYQLVAQPFIVTIILLFNPTFPVDKLPKLDWAQLGHLLTGMLGIS